MIHFAHLRFGDFEVLQPRGAVLSIFSCWHPDRTIDQVPPAVTLQLHQGVEGLVRRAHPLGHGRAPQQVTVPTKTLQELPSASILLDDGTRPMRGSVGAVSYEYASRKDKVGGWPHALEAMRLPSCPQCTQRMPLAVQLSDGYGENARLFVFQCEGRLAQLSWLIQDDTW